MDQNDLKALPRHDQGVLAAGILAFIASFFPYYGAEAGGFSSSTSAWHSYATLAILLILAATVLAAVLLFSGANLPTLPVSWNVILFGLSALGTLLIIIRSFTLDSGEVAGFSYGLEWGAYVLMILCLVQTVFAFMRLRASGDETPWGNRGSATTPPPAA